jgi:hypothetical protein
VQHLLIVSAKASSFEISAWVVWKLRGVSKLLGLLIEGFEKQSMQKLVDVGGTQHIVNSAPKGIKELKTWYSL